MQRVVDVHQLLFAFVACIFDTMHLLGITFILYLLKLSAGNGNPSVSTSNCCNIYLHVEMLGFNEPEKRFINL